MRCGRELYAATNVGGAVPALAWQVLAFGAVGVSLLVIAVRTLVIARRPIHLRWELAPVPHAEGKGGYGGSYLEAYEWWRSPRRLFRTGALIYTAKEMLLLRSVWQHNRALWPLTYSFHIGMYLVAGLSLGLAANVVLMAVGVDLLSVQAVRLGISALALVGYLLGSLGTIGLLLKRALDPNLRPFSTISRYINLLFLAAVFLSGSYAWVHSGDYVAELSRFADGLISLDPNTSVAFPLSLHLGISLLFLLYLPLTDMIHFMAKYFTYHAIRWDDRPKDESMDGELRGLLLQPVTWSASHVGGEGKKNWTDVTRAKPGDEPTP